MSSTNLLFELDKCLSMKLVISLTNIAQEHRYRWYSNKYTMFFASGADLNNCLSNIIKFNNNYTTVSSLDRLCLCYFPLMSSVWSVPRAYIMFVFIQITINWMSQLPLILQIVPMAISLIKFKCWKLPCSRLSPKLDELVWYWFGHFRSVWDHT